MHCIDVWRGVSNAQHEAPAMPPGWPPITISGYGPWQVIARRGCDRPAQELSSSSPSSRQGGGWCGKASVSSVPWHTIRSNDSWEQSIIQKHRRHFPSPPWTLMIDNNQGATMQLLIDTMPVNVCLYMRWQCTENGHTLAGGCRLHSLPSRIHRL